MRLARRDQLQLWSFMKTLRTMLIIIQLAVTRSSCESNMKDENARLIMSADKANVPIIRHAVMDTALAAAPLGGVGTMARVAANKMNAAHEPKRLSYKCLTSVLQVSYKCLTSVLQVSYAYHCRRSELGSTMAPPSPVSIGVACAELSPCTWRQALPSPVQVGGALTEPCKGCMEGQVARCFKKVLGKKEESIPST